MTQKQKFFSVLYKLILLCIILLTYGCTDPEVIRKSALLYFEEGNQAFEVRDYQASIWYYLHAIELDPETPEFHYNLGLAYYEIGNYPEAIDAFKQVAEKVPGIADTHYNLALAYNKLYNSEMANKHYNQYQSMLSARIAKANAQKQQQVPQEQAVATSVSNNSAPPQNNSAPMQNKSPLPNKNPKLAKQ
jgi:tetratricopeptide (TPR) repeat protein